MFVKFLIIAGFIGVLGPGHNEGGFEAVQEKGPKAAIERAWEQKKDVTSTQELYKKNFNG